MNTNMAKAKITVTVTRIIDLDEFYDANQPLEERLQNEIKYAQDLFWEWVNAESVQWETKGEIIEEGANPSE